MPVLNHIKLFKDSPRDTSLQTEIKKSTDFLIEHLKEARKEGLTVFPYFPLTPRSLSRPISYPSDQQITSIQDKVLKFSINQALVNLSVASDERAGYGIYGKDVNEKETAKVNLINLGDKIFTPKSSSRLEQQISTAFNRLDTDLKEDFRIKYEQIKSDINPYVLNGEKTRKAMAALSQTEPTKHTAQHNSYTPAQILKTLGLFTGATATAAGLMYQMSKPPEIEITHPNIIEHSQQPLSEKKPSLNLTTKLKEPRSLIQDWENHIYPNKNEVRIQQGESLSQIILKNYKIQDPNNQEIKSLTEYLKSLSTEEQKQTLINLSIAVAEFNLKQGNTAAFFGFDPEEKLNTAETHKLIKQLNAKEKLFLPEVPIQFQGEN